MEKLPDIDVDHKPSERKCSRLVCENRETRWWNASTRASYCTPCARKINEFSSELCVDKERWGDTLTILMGFGVITIIDKVYIGIASDGQQVQLGNVGKEDDLNAYLVDYPNPKNW